jgi:hypothetical protein
MGSYDHWDDDAGRSSRIDTLGVTHPQEFQRIDLFFRFLAAVAVEDSSAHHPFDCRTVKPSRSWR